jgi:Ser/Thr protein kinase RdoA (MazF antagonist)
LDNAIQVNTDACAEGFPAMSILPSDEILAQFGVRLITALGGRLNPHWLVESQREKWVLRRWYQSAESIDYELRLVARLAALGWPVAPVVEGPVELAGHYWSLAPFLPGDPPSAAAPHAEQRARGRLLAQFHADLSRIEGFGQREGWRRCEAVLTDPALDQTLTMHEQTRSEEVRILRWHLERARRRIVGLKLQARPGMIIHGDFTPWNLRFTSGRLVGVLDFELAHWDHRVGDFALSWRGKYDEVIHGYAEVSPLEPEEWELITPLWWANLIENACRDMRNGTCDDGWTIKKLLQRSVLMGQDAVGFG